MYVDHAAGPPISQSGGFITETGMRGLGSSRGAAVWHYNPEGSGEVPSVPQRAAANTGKCHTLAGSVSLVAVSAFAFKGTTANARQTANELGANYLLQGSVRHAGNRLRISAQLIDVSGRPAFAAALSGETSVTSTPATLLEEEAVARSGVSVWTKTPSMP